MYLSYLRGSALGLSDLHHMPFVGPFLLKHLELTAGHRAIYPKPEQQHSAPHLITANADTWSWFFNRYRLMPTDELLFIEQLHRVTSLPFEMPLGLARSMAVLDVGDPPIIDYHDHRTSSYFDAL
jgi:hypothetical protein